MLRPPTAGAFGRIGKAITRAFGTVCLIVRRNLDVAEDKKTALNLPDENDESVGDTDAGLPPANLSTRVKFEIFGEEMIEKRVKASGNSGRVYLPPDWVGHKVKIIRID
jgi:putative transposon-encoded protein